PMETARDETSHLCRKPNSISCSHIDQHVAWNQEEFSYSVLGSFLTSLQFQQGFDIVTKPLIPVRGFT
ncbi:MAG: hypothetical protein DRH70_04950, partial [Candidatus Coatesbacteria bacterium]